MQVGEIQDELQAIELGDKRLYERSASLLKTLGSNPTASINEACNGWNETKAAYRFFDNDDIDPDDILRPHREATIARIQSQSVVCIAQDTTELDYTKHPPKDARHLNRPERYGFYDHCQVAFTPEKLCLGVLDVHLFDRVKESLGTSRGKEHDPIETKEGMRWLEGYRKCCELAGRCPDTQIVSLADSEADIYDIYVEAERHETPADFVIRSQRKRATPEKDPDGGPAAYIQMQQAIARSEIVATREIRLPKTPKRAARTAKLEIRAKRVPLKAPHAKAASLPPVTLSVVSVTEVDGPGDETEVNWLLLSSLPIDSIEDILRIIDLYVARWPIEVFFRVFKSGCRVEEIQLETRDRLKRALMLYKVIAWRIMFVTFLGRQCPELPCDVVFSEPEWKSVWKVSQKEEPPEHPPVLSEFIPVLATLGGYNGRRGDGPPGAEVIWRGVRRMHDFATCWTAFGPEC